MKTSIVMLKVVYDESNRLTPANWDWSANLGPDETATVVWYAEVE